MKKAILEALEARYNAQISEADATITIYLENSVGIGEHPQHIDCLLYTSPSPRDVEEARMPSSA